MFNSTKECTFTVSILINGRMVLAFTLKVFKIYYSNYVSNYTVLGKSATHCRFQRFNEVRTLSKCCLNIWADESAKVTWNK